MLSVCCTFKLGCGLWQSAQATPYRAWVDECQAMVGELLSWHLRQRSTRDSGRILLPCGSWHVVQSNPIAPQIWCDAATFSCWAMFAWQRKQMCGVIAPMWLDAARIEAMSTCASSSTLGSRT